MRDFDFSAPFETVTMCRCFFLLWLVITLDMNFIFVEILLFSVTWRNFVFEASLEGLSPSGRYKKLFIWKFYCACIWLCGTLDSI